ncbi:alanine racemase [Stackebrandtia nassauensis]|uniref:D-serine deaminase n=1 Tax=Stackebrandtia nassauensis (strain DSM 44728 / CIP 108903 / NRRL B-16338 / NBRC 102104 / LLR-40K-21) TaxID=446470 RepID=D3PYE4_STANL|nr:alanine racemase [Stackebrandtia nassauensis]ADD41511.1 D-serine deaminase [Stackebrandtia nassauensis DSM 44728]
MLDLESLYTERLDWRFKAVPAAAEGLRLRDWLSHRPHVSKLETPLMTLDADAVAHNISAMAHWCDANRLAHAPHGKTTMAPALWDQQLRAGAWAITLANVPQLRVARAFGVPRVIVANELVSRGSLQWLAAWAAEGATILCFVDSVAAVSLMDDALRHGDDSLDVVVELGGYGGRAGARDFDSARKVAAAVRSARRLRLAGVGGYEGAIAHTDSTTDLQRVDEFLRGLRDLHESLRYETDEPVVTVGGSQYYDQIAEHLSDLSSARVVLRAGSYVTHDDGLYSRLVPAARGRSGPALRAALRAYVTVLSKPEQSLAILDAGRRDLSFDAGWPVPLGMPGAKVTELNDQHGYLRGDLSGVEVGDILRLGISHPCTSFDKWNLIPVLDAEGFVVDAVRTFF